MPNPVKFHKSVNSFSATAPSKSRRSPHQPPRRGADALRVGKRLIFQVAGVGNGRPGADACEAARDAGFEHHRRQLARKAEALVVFVDHQQAPGAGNRLAHRLPVQGRDAAKVQHAGGDLLGLESVYGDRATIRLTIRTRPEAQFSVQRELRALIKKHFEERGIRLADELSNGPGGSL